MICGSSLTSGLGLAVAACASLLLAGCGAGDAGQQATQSGTRLLATTDSAMLPNTQRPGPVRPCVLIATRSTSLDSASATIQSAGEPTGAAG